MSVSLTFTTLGELIKKKRVEIGISLSEVSRVTGISKGVISKIESGETKSPELRTLKPIADVLKIPYEDIIEYSIQVERRYGLYDDFLSEAIEISNPSLINKVAIKFLENIRKETCSSLDFLYTLANTSTNNDAKVTLYTTIVAYARVHGLPYYIAKGLYQKYLIEREDLKRLEESFIVGEEVLHYVDFLSQEEKIIFYFRMSLHAHNIKKYDRCIELGRTGYNLDLGTSMLKQRVIYAMINSFIHTGDFQSAEKHLEMSESLDYTFIEERSKFIRANIYFGKGEYGKSIPILQECLLEATDDTRVHILNDLMESFFKLGELESIQTLLDTEEKSICLGVKTPHKHREIGRFFKLKGAWQVEIGKYNDAISSYLRSMVSYEQINSNEDIHHTIGEILSIHYLYQKPIDLDLLGKLVEVYNVINKKSNDKKVVV